MRPVARPTPTGRRLDPVAFSQGFSRKARPRKKKTEAASRSRSKRIEARRAEKGSFVSRARTAGRMISPARAGRKLAAKPIAVAEKAGSRGTLPTGRRIQVHRQARIQ